MPGRNRHREERRAPSLVLRQLQELLQAGARSPLAAQNAVLKAQGIIENCSYEDLEEYAPSVARRVGGQHPPEQGRVVQSAMAPTRILVMGGIEEVPLSDDSAEFKLEFTAGSGWLIGMSGSIINQPFGAARSSIGLRLFINDGEELITNGTSSDFSMYSDLFKESSWWFPLRRYMCSTDNLYAQFRNFSTTTAYTPSLAFSYCRERDLRHEDPMFRE